jgi:uncharacterized protein (TIGR02996 family)
VARGRQTDVFPGPSRPLDDIERRLLDDIAASPDDDQPRLVLADWWMSGPDPARGELVAMQCRGEDASELLDAYEQRWLGPFTAARLDRFAFVRGFADRPLLVYARDAIATAADTRRASPRVYAIEDYGRHLTGRDVHGARVVIDPIANGALVARPVVPSHPHLVTLLDLVRLQGGDALVYAWPGTPLRRRSHPLATVLAVGRQLAGALAALHAAAIIHTGVRIEHVFVEADRVRLGGLGEAAPRTADPEWFSPQLALDHLSPEQLTGRGLTAATDVFSLAVLLATLRLGRRPLGANAETDLQLLLQMRDGGYELPDDAELRPLLVAMMAADPAARPTAVEVERALAQLVASQRG